MQLQYAVRKETFFNAVSSKRGTLAYIESTRDKARSLFVYHPIASPLRAAITGTIQREGYKIEKIILESFTNHHVTANLYLPAGKGPFPAALVLCGHEDASKATPSYQQTAILFAKNGFVSLVVDPISQSERMQLTDSLGKALTRGGTTEHTLLNASANLLGTSLPADELWDNVKVLDYLIKREEVDSARIGCIGNSGGAMQAIYLASYDRRIKVFAPCSYLSSRERTLEISGPADGCAQVPGEGKLGLELVDYLIAAAPKPMLVMAGRYDFIDYPGVLTAVEELKKVYAALGKPSQIELFTYDDGHGISKPKREAAVTWFRKWFYHDSYPIHEDNQDVLSPKELQCTTTGQVNLEYPNEIDLRKRNLSLYDDYSASRKAFLNFPQQEIISKLRDILNIANPPTSVDIALRYTNDDKQKYFASYIFRVNGQVPLPVLLARSGSPSKIILYLNDKGKSAWADSIFKNLFTQKDFCVVFADLRGTGETEDKAEYNDPKYYNKEYRNAMLSLHIGKPIAGQRVSDIETLIVGLNKMTGLETLPVDIYANGVTALPALLAALMNKHISHVYLSNTIRSFKEVITFPAHKNAYSYVIPGILKYLDIPDLETLAGTHKVFYVK